MLLVYLVFILFEIAFYAMNKPFKLFQALSLLQRLVRNDDSNRFLRDRYCNLL